MIARREFIALVGGAVAAGPVAAHAQQAALPVIGFLSSRSPGESAAVVTAFRQGLREVGFVEGQNLIVAFRWAEGNYDRLPAMAAELIDLKVALLFTAGGTPPAIAAKASTATIPIVFSAINDPVRSGLVASLNRPGGNITGMGVFNQVLGAKRIELLKELVPTASAMAYLVNPANSNALVELKEAEAAATALKLKLHVLNASTEHGLNAAFAELARLHPSGLVVSGEPFFDSQRDRLVALSAQHAVVACYAWREYVVAGGLLSYGTSLTNSYRHAGRYVGRILKGEKPEDLPIMQPTNFHLALNLKTAKALGLTVPATLLARADEVIE